MPEAVEDDKRLATAKREDKEGGGETGLEYGFLVSNHIFPSEKYEPPPFVTVGARKGASFLLLFLEESM